MSKNGKISEDERALFREAVADAVPLRPQRLALRSAPPPPRRLAHHREQPETPEDSLGDPLDPTALESGEELLFCRPGLQHNVLRKLRRGHYPVGAELDLHGLRVAEARQAVLQLLHQATTHHLRCVRIIHGKGNSSLHQYPVLKGMVNHWLRQRDEVLAFCSARHTDGGTGAIYVLLRHKGR